MDKDDELLGATAAPAEIGPPAWLKTLLVHQAQQFQQLFTPALQHVSAEQRATSTAVPIVPGNQTLYGGAIPPEVLEWLDSAVQCRDKRIPQSSTPVRTAIHRGHGNTGNRRDMMWQPPHEAPKVKLATCVGKEEWDSFLLPFERQA